MPATLHRLRSRPERLRRTQAEQLRQIVLDLPGLPDGAVGAIITAIDRETAAENGWAFVMLSPAQNKAVVRWLDANSTRPRKAVLLWAEMFDHLRRDTGEIALTREEMAALIGEQPRHVSTIMSELERIGAISRRRDGRGVRYFMNPNVGTHLAGAARDRAQAEAPALTLITT
jgi:DNA-binding transcriptional ArsR family regulator